MDQDYESIIRSRETLISTWRNSSEYRDLCSAFSSYATSLVRIGEQYMSLCAAKQAGDYARTEIASNSELHRGFYCPSLVYDRIVGNVCRGKLLKRLSARSKTYFVYDFDKDNKLILCKRFYNGRIAHTEHLFYTSNHVYGVTLEPNGKLQCVSAETYNNGEIVCYERALVYLANGVNQCIRIWREEYEYDPVGLKVCHYHEFYPQQSLYINKRFTFDWEENRMAGYLSEEIIGCTEPVVLFSNYYSIKP